MASLAAVTTICLSAAACGGTSGVAAKPGAVASAASASNADASLSACQAGEAQAAVGADSGQDPLAGLSAAKIEAEALADFDAGRSVQWTSTLIDAEGNVMRSCVEYRLPKPCSEAGAIAGSCAQYQDDSACSGTASFSKKGSKAVLGSFKFVGALTPHTYVSPNAGYWDSTVPAALREKFSLLKGKYIPVRQLRPGTSFGGAVGNQLSIICSSVNIRASLEGLMHVTKGAVTVLHGSRVVPLKQSDGTTSVVAYVTDTRKPKVVQSVWHVNASPDVTYTDISVGAPVDLAPPPPSQVMDPAKVGLPVVP